MGCGTPSAHDWVAFGLDPSLTLTSYQFARDGTLLRRTRWSAPGDVQTTAFQTVSTGQYLLTVVDKFYPSLGSTPDPTNVRGATFIKRHRCY
jgi:hypothetical protein